MDKKIPVMAPKGDNNKDNPRLASENENFTFIAGIAATHMPNNKLDVQNKKPTNKAGRIFINDLILLIIEIKVL